MKLRIVILILTVGTSFGQAKDLHWASNLMAKSRQDSGFIEASCGDVISRDTFYATTQYNPICMTGPPPSGGSCELKIQVPSNTPVHYMFFALDISSTAWNTCSWYNNKVVMKFGHMEKRRYCLPDQTWIVYYKEPDFIEPYDLTVKYKSTYFDYAGDGSYDICLFAHYIEDEVTTTYFTEVPTETTTENENPTPPSDTCSSCGQYDASQRIVGGEETQPHQYPWQCALEEHGSTQKFCGASLISPTCILTAAHCTDGQDMSKISVRCGAHDHYEDQGFVRNVATLHQHNGYDGDTVDNDIAILILDEAMPIGDNTIGTICLPKTNAGTNSGEEVTVSGWGTTSSGGNQPDKLMDVNVTVVADEECKKAYGPNGITENMFCAGAEGKDSCQGDSGGPLQFHSNGKMKQSGIVSWGYGCAYPTYYGVYAKVTNYEHWIKEKCSGACFVN